MRNRPQLAAAIGRGVRQITEYLQRGMPRERRGGYCIEDCAAWIAANIRPTGRAEHGPEPEASGEKRSYWECYKTREQALVEEIKRRQLEGELVDADDAARLAERRIGHAKALLEQIPDRILGLLPKQVAIAARKNLRARVAEMIEDVLTALAEEAESGYGPGEADEKTDV